MISKRRDVTWLNGRKGAFVIGQAPSRPLALRRSIEDDAKRAQKASFIAASDYESAAMDHDIAAMGRFRHGALVKWLVVVGQHNQKMIPRPVRASP